MAEYSQAGGADNDRKLFCGGLSINTTKETLQGYFEKFGRICDSVVMKDPTSGRSRCFGFVTFEESESVDRTQNERPHTLDGKQIDTKRAIPREDQSPESRFVSQKIFVGGLKREVTKEQIIEYFTKFGAVSDCILVTDKATGQSRGFGFVTFEDTDSVDKVIIYRPHQIYNSRADVKKALSKEEMEQIRYKQEQQGYQQGAVAAAGYPPADPNFNSYWGAPQTGGYYDSWGGGGGYADPYASYGGGTAYSGGADNGHVAGGWGNAAPISSVQSNPNAGGGGAPSQTRGGYYQQAPSSRGAGGPVRGNAGGVGGRGGRGGRGGGAGSGRGRGQGPKTPY